MDNPNSAPSPPQTRLAEIMDELHGESERACAIVAAAVLDELLGEILSQYLLVSHPDAYRDLLDSDNLDSPLGSFGARIHAAFAFGLISVQDRSGLREIKKIRNEFAHDRTTSFSDEDTAHHATKLHKSGARELYISRDHTPRNLFEANVTWFIGALEMKLNLIRGLGLHGDFDSVFRMHVK